MLQTKTALLPYARWIPFFFGGGGGGLLCEAKKLDRNIIELTEEIWANLAKIGHMIETKL